MAETRIKPKTGYFDRYFALGAHQGSLAGYKGDPYAFAGAPYLNQGIILPRRDDVLIEDGGGGPRAIEKYMRLFYDSQVISAWEKLTGEIVQRHWEVEPVSSSDKDEEVAEFVRQVLHRMGTNTRQSYGKEMLVSANSAFDTFIRGLCESLVLGISIGEICWMRQGRYIVPSEVKIRDPRRFIFILNPDGTVSPRLITTQSPVDGHALPLRSMVIHRHWCHSSFMDPYGAGLGRQLYSLVEFRRTLLSFWLQYADKHTTPTAIGTFELGTPEEEVDALLRSLQRLGQETSLVVPQGMKVDLLENRSSPDAYEKLLEYTDQQISFLINGENTVGQETGNVGSYARDQVSDSVRMRKAKAFSEELDETINATLVRWIVELNYPGAPVPRIKRNFNDLDQKEDPVKVVQMLTQLQAIGYKVGDLDWVRDKLSVPSLEEAPQPPGGGMMPMSESENSDPKSSQEMLDEQNGSLGAFSGGGESSLRLFDFTEFDEDAPYKRTSKDRISEQISERFSGTFDDVGFQRISTDNSSPQASASRVGIDEYTSPGEIAHNARRLIEEVKKITTISSEEFDLAQIIEMDLGRYEASIRTDNLSQEDADKMLELLKKAYRLNRRAVHQEAVVVDTKKAGYMTYFAPYFM